MRIARIPVISTLALGVLCGAAAAGATFQPQSSIKLKTIPALGLKAHITGPTGTLYDQTGSLVANAQGSLVYFNPVYSAYNDQAADDFTVPAGFTWILQEVDVVGSYDNLPASTVNVFIYNDSSGLPGSLVQQFLSVTPTGGLATGSFEIPISPNLILGSGTYWVSVQANMSADLSQWFWTLRDQGNPESGAEGAWQNPGGGFGTCSSWGHIFTDCGTSAPGYDLAFKLIGQVGDAELAITKTASVSSVTGPIAGPPYWPGAPFTYTLSVTNNGPYLATGVVVTDPIDPQLGYQSNSCGATFAANTLTWTVGSLANGANAPCTVTISPLAGASGSIGNTATVAGDQPDPTPGNNASTATIVFTNSGTPVDLQVTKSASVASPVQRNQQFTYALTAHNNDASNAAVGVTVSDPLDAQLSYVSTGACTGSHAFAAGTYTWTVGSLAASGTQTCTFTVQVGASASGTIGNTATIFATNPDPTPGNDTSTVNLNVASADLAALKTTGFTWAIEPGDTTTFTVTASNGGPDGATTVRVQDTLDPQLAYVSDTCGNGFSTGVRTIASIASGGSSPCTVTVQANPTALGAITNTASILSADQFDPNTANNTSAPVAIGVVHNTGFDSVPMYTYTTSRAAGGPAFSWVEISGTGTALNLADDGDADVPIGFSFPFYGGAQTSVSVGNNGGLLFLPGGHTNNPNTALPGFASPFIAPYWDDLDASAGNVYTQTFTTCPATQGGTGRCFVAEWYQRPHYSGIGSATFEAILYENGTILTQYLTTDFGDAALNNGVSATIGIQGTTPAEVLQYEFDTPGSTPPSFAILFQPNGQAIPVLGGFGLLALALLLAAAGVVALRRL
ncbi:MAG TPA: DUF11 domain-containing protein [Thermoanaerobaculaceae bacterium]|nr:DUF11 domain-containing protein [Thermoanaerobaculaceae bacterium]